MLEVRIRIDWKKLAIGAGVLVALLVLVLLVREVVSLVSSLKGHPKPAHETAVGAAASIDHSNFAYLMPAADDAWTFDADSVATEEEKGVVKYKMHMEFSGADIVFSQQQFPAELAPRGSDKFNNFINSQRAVINQKAGDGTVYFMTALKNGSPTSGADTVIFATDKVLMFARSNTVVGYDGWSKLLATMKPSK